MKPRPFQLGNSENFDLDLDKANSSSMNLDYINSRYNKLELDKKTIRKTVAFKAKAERRAKK
ncbi:hypothetical protein BpHYR1_032711 [Brachionus plicatilis]|uniref:Uncharacterized protein n=1 Tax=Brachionus plicatilis TaxID=10195 RepID=A0A3M7PDN6_BRAPC|nr:hypothetical protein BpHYR1_032711 [Brachionus plicatilis]